MKIYRYSGAGNSFVVIDGRGIDSSRFANRSTAHLLCSVYDTDGLMVLDSDMDGLDFRMSYFNSDGSSGMMCGNGGRCIVAFADLLGIKPATGRFIYGESDPSQVYFFRAPDGVHKAEILSRQGETKTVRIQMKDVSEVREVALPGYGSAFFVDTGARHLVVFVSDTEAVDVEVEGRRLRHLPEFAPQGVNVDFVSCTAPGTITVRTFEKGVEAETLACGTGITASAICCAVKTESRGPCSFDVQARQDRMKVDFERIGEVFSAVFLTGPTLCEGELE